MIDNDNHNNNALQVMMCAARLVPPKQSVLSILVRFSNVMQSMITHCNIIEPRPPAAWGAATLDLTKHKLLGSPPSGILNI